MNLATTLQQQQHNSSYITKIIWHCPTMHYVGNMMSSSCKKRKKLPSHFL